jgi:hypothetical protein
MVPGDETFIYAGTFDFFTCIRIGKIYIIYSGESGPGHGTYLPMSASIIRSEMFFGCLRIIGIVVFQAFDGHLVLNDRYCHMSGGAGDGGDRRVVPRGIIKRHVIHLRTLIIEDA